jgi:hypothetical protein
MGEPMSNAKAQSSNEIPNPNWLKRSFLTFGHLTLI